MYTPEYIENSLQILNAHKELEESILKLIVARLKKTNLAITESAKYEIETAQQAGILYDEIVNKVSETLDVSKAEIKKIFAEAETEVFNYPDEDIAAAGYDVSEFKTFTPKMRKIYAAAISKTFVDVSNLTKTTARAVHSATKQSEKITRIFVDILRKTTVFLYAFFFHVKNVIS